MEYVEREKVSIEFRMDAIQNGYKSDQVGHPVFDEVPFITIQIPGSQNTIIDTKVDEIYKRRFAAEFRRFMDGITVGDGGWRLESWPAVNTAQVKNLKYQGVHTVEQLAGMSDTSCQSVGMGTIELRTKAKAALEAANSGAATEAQAVENKRLNDELADLRAQFAEMLKMNAAPKEEARKPGRPRNEPAADRPASGS